MRRVFSTTLVAPCVVLCQSAKSGYLWKNFAENRDNEGWCTIHIPVYALCGVPCQSKKSDYQS